MSDAAATTTSTALSALPVGVALSLSTNLKSGPFGVLALTGVAASVLIPITQVRNFYAITIGYGLSVAAMGLVLNETFKPPVTSIGGFLTTVVIAYGIRLASYLFLRQSAGYKPKIKREDPARIKRVPFALSLALFYAFMTCPTMYVLRAQLYDVFGSNGGGAIWKFRTAWAGAIVGAFGMVLEALADAQKFAIKLKDAKNPLKDDMFKGPTGGAYKLVRHPNYLGEMLFWTGLWICGVSSFGKSVVGWICSSVGLYGILSIMNTAARGLEQRQSEKYGGQPKYEQWKRDVRAPLIPFLTSTLSSLAKIDENEGGSDIDVDEKKSE